MDPSALRPAKNTGKAKTFVLTWFGILFPDESRSPSPLAERVVSSSGNEEKRQQAGPRASWSGDALIGRLGRMLRRLRRQARQADPQPAPRAQRREGLIFESLEPRMLLSADLAVVDAAGLAGYFDAVQTRLESDVFSAPIPLIGTQLVTIESGDIAGQIADALRNFSLPTPPGERVTPDAVKEGLEAALGDLIEDGRIDATTNAEHSHYEFALTLAGSADERIDLDLALGEDPLISARLGTHDEVDLVV